MTQFILDNFTGADATPITSHTGDSGVVWAGHPDWNGTFASTYLTINNNGTYSHLRNSYSGGGFPVGAYATAVPPTPDYSIEVGLVNGPAADLWILARSGLGNGKSYAVHIQTGGSLSLSLQYLSPSQNNFGSFYSGPFGGGVIRYEIVGTTHTMYLDGTAVGSGTDANLASAGVVGLVLTSPVSSTITPAFDYISVTNLGALSFWTNFVETTEVDA